ncbi:MAG: flagellar transcriptional regulator FlhD [Burkholderiaceae bacterium]
MRTEQSMANEIAEINLSYLILAQQMIRTDRVSALYRLGISEPVADLIDALKPSQLLKVASGGAMMCRLRVQDETIWDLLSDHARSDSLAGEKSAERLHARILMAGKHAETVE